MKRIKINISIIIFLLMGGLLVTSCEKQIDPGNWDFSWPIIDMNVSTPAPLIGDTVDFQGIAKTGSSSIVNWEWTINDSSETIVTLTGAHPAYRFDQAGTYTIGVVGTDSAGNTGYISKDVTVLKDTGILIRVMVFCAKPASGYTMDNYLELANIINKYKPNLVLLRQTDSSTTRNNKIDVPALIGQKTGMHSSFAKNFDYRGGGYGNVILSSYPFIDSSSVVLPVSPGASGSSNSSLALGTVLLNDKSGTSLLFAGTELATGDEARRVFQMNAILPHISKTNEPVIFCGDFNENPGDQAFNLLTTGFTVGCTSNGCPLTGAIHNGTYDYVLFSPSKDFVLVRSTSVKETISKYYLPLLVDLRYNPQ